MKRVLNAEFGPDSTISNAAELAFRTLAMGTWWDNAPRLSSRLVPFWIPTTIPTNSVSHGDGVVRLCFPYRHEIRLGA
eukprot:4681419-Prorocentrum_lima.AAC.1